jgi:hypothetical protein
MKTKALSLFALVFIALCVSTLRADPLAYAAVSGYAGVDNVFGTVDLVTGAFTPINLTEPGQLTLASFGGSLYGVVEDGDTLYKVDPATGDLTTVGTLTHAFDGAVVIGSTSAGLYIMDEGSQLDSVNPTTGAATVIGPTGAPGFANWTALSDNGSALYLGDQNNFYSVDTTTGAASLIGAYGTPIAGQPIALIGAMLFEGGVLYGVQESDSFIDTIDPSTGAATAGPELENGGAIYGLAPDPLSTSTSPVPEPRSSMLLVGLLGAFGLLVRRRLSNL